MLLFHPVILIRRPAKGLFIKRHCNIKKLSQIKFGNNVRLGEFTRINCYSKNGKIVFGNNVYAVNRNSFLVGGNIIIGNNTLLGSDICITSENHGMEVESDLNFGKQPLICRDVVIGDGCWISEKVIILPGVHIGKKCVIGAGAVVTKDIPDYSIAVGNPARVIKKYNFETKVWEKLK